MKHSWGLCGILLCYLLPAAMGQQPAGTGAREPAKGPVQVAPAQAAPVTGVGKAAAKSESDDRNVHLDVVVTDKAGRPAPGLSVTDFTLLDNDRPRKIVSFQAHAPGIQAAGPRPRSSSSSTR
jgi:hypothetical protein